MRLVFRRRRGRQKHLATAFVCRPCAGAATGSAQCRNRGRRSISMPRTTKTSCTAGWQRSSSTTTSPSATLSAAACTSISLAGQDAVLATASRNGKIEPTALYKQLIEVAGDIRPKMIGIASSANVYAGSEIERGQVQQFIGLLTRLAIIANGARGSYQPSKSDWHRQRHRPFRQHAMAQCSAGALLSERRQAGQRRAGR